MNFTGFGKWIEIFRGGKQTDSEGRVHDGDALIDQAVSTFKPAEHEPPLVVGHPADNSPAFGWVEGLQTGVKDGVKVLLAKFKQVVPEFEELVKRGVYKKRSASFYPDGRLRHVGFLGGMPPAVKGLADIGFSEGGISFEFEEVGAASSREHSDKEGKGMTFKEKVKGFLSFLGVDVTKVPDEALPTNSEFRIPNSEFTGFSEADVLAREEAARKKAEEETRKKVAAEFAEAARKEAKQRRSEAIALFCDQGVKEGKILPAWLRSGLKEFMESLDAEGAVQFAEGDQGKKSPYAWFRSFLEELPKTVTFSEVAKRDQAASGSAGEKLFALTRAKMEKEKLSYSAAFSEVQMEHPDLATEMASELATGRRG